MNLQQVKEILNKAGFSEESLKVMNEVLDEAIKNGYLTKEAKDKLLGIIDIEVEIANLEADAMEEVAMALESFADEIDKAVDKTEKDLESTDKDLLDDIKDIAGQAVTSPQ
jgi:heterodisulfide reductase subunit C